MAGEFGKDFIENKRLRFLINGRIGKECVRAEKYL
jgi:hypothetical protein